MTITIDEAIQELSESAYAGAVTLGKRHEEAEKLGIEALKWFSVHRKRNWRMVPKLLPGETEES